MLKSYSSQPLHYQTMQDYYDLCRCENCRNLKDRLCDPCKKMENIRKNREVNRGNEQKFDISDVAGSEYTHCLKYKDDGGVF